MEGSISAENATLVVCAVLIVFGVVIPFLRLIPKVKDILQFNWLIVTFFLSCMVGVMIDFSNLSDTIKLTVIIGAILVSLLFMFLTSNFKKDMKVKLTHGNSSIETMVDGDGDGKVAGTPVIADSKDVKDRVPKPLKKIIDEETETEDM